ncbi:hypothetical protein [Halovenus halobia]|uniref:hypothetical protein n=1 Tax=Halovenus halobia TaxID=3396622 RepID=UPI003F576754
MMKRQQPRDDSVTSGYLTAGLLGAVLVVVAHPVLVALSVFTVGAVALSARTAWQQATSHGLGLPGISARLCVETGTTHERDAWAMRVSLTER